MESEYSLISYVIRTLIRYALSSATWMAIAVVVFSVSIVTRIITGFQSGSGAVGNAEEPRVVRMTPYWFPWLGHSLSFAWDHVKCIQGARLVVPFYASWSDDWDRSVY